MNKGKVILGTLAGVAAGALAGILFAPKKGSAARKQIKDKSDDYLNQIKSKFNNLLDTLTVKLERTKNDAENLAAKGKGKIENAKKK